MLRNLLWTRTFSPLRTGFAKEGPENYGSNVAVVARRRPCRAKREKRRAACPDARSVAYVNVVVFV